ncbi:hypothetical protein Tco_1479003, partial [Tanacetum coccineum]
MRREKKEEFEGVSFFASLKMRDSIERDKTLADLGPWEDQISWHEGEIKFASFVMEVVYSSPNFDINGVVLIPSLPACEACWVLRNNWLTADIQSKNLSTMDMQVKLENNKVGPSQVSELYGKITNGVGEMLRSQNKIVKNEK